MSGLAGILRTDGAPARQADLQVMTDLLAHRGPDGRRQHVDGPLAMAHLSLLTTTPARAGSQPLRSDDGALCLTFDGRIDNREELRAALGPDRALLRDASDPELLLAAYRRWHRAAFARVVGDFALALWDGPRAQLVCARDVLGKRPFYYHARAGHFRWASEPQAVLADPGVPRRVNEGMVAEHLAARVTSTAETLYLDVQRLPPAHLLVVDRDGLRVSRYWSWEPEAAPIRDDAGHVAAFLEVFRTAVGAHMEGPQPVAAELSGGVDSSAVVAVAAERLGDDARSALAVYSLVGPGRKWDETPYIREVAEHVGVVAHETEPSPAGAAFYDGQARRYLDLPEPPNLAMHRAHYAAAHTTGARVLLTGKGGDEWFTGSPFAYADRLRGLRPAGVAALRAEARADRLVWGSRGPLQQFLRDGVIPLLPASAQRLAARAAGRTDPPAWLDPAFCRRVGLDERIRVPPPRGRPLATAHAAQALDDGWLVHIAEVGERAAASVGLELRSPFDDRRVVELGLGLPEAVRRRDSATKWVVRVAMAGLVPDSVRTRGGKTGFQDIFFRELESQGGRRLFENLAIEEAGWVDGGGLRASYDAFATAQLSERGHAEVWGLWAALSTERWFAASLPAGSA